MFKYQLGIKLRDGITGFEGIATIRAQYLGGSTRYCLEIKHSDGKVNEEWFDGERLREIPKEK